MSHSISLSRPGRCAGRVPLSLLVYKLIRSGEEAAARALPIFPQMPRPLDALWHLFNCGGAVMATYRTIRMAF